MRRYDKYWIGICLGLLFPAVFLYIYISQMHLQHPLETLIYNSGVLLGTVLPFTILPDMALLFVFYQLDYWKIAKGTVIGMIPYILISIIITLL